MEKKTFDSSGKGLRYITEAGKTVAVVIDLPEYEAMVERLADLEDSLDLKEAIASAEGFTSLEALQAELADEDDL